MEFDFDSDGLEPRAIRYKIKGKHYSLLEASEAVAVEYQDRLLANANIDEVSGKAYKLSGINKTEPWLVSECSYELEGEGAEIRRLANGNPDPKYKAKLETVNAWPSRHVQQLYHEVKRISDIDQPTTVEQIQRQLQLLQLRLERLKKAEAESLAKNGQGATTGTSV